jgi:hypothetical protein
MRYILAICLISLFPSCDPESQNKTISYQNIVILSDLSSRLNNLPQKDTAEIYKIVEYFKNECVKPGEKIGDKSCITFSAFTDRIAASVDISQIRKLGDKQSFINSTGKYKNNGLDKKLLDFKNVVTSVYDTERNPGLDLISMLIEKIEKEPLVKKDTFFTNGIDTTFVNYQNNFFIFTDGYLEYGNKQSNSQFYFGESEIERVRNFCILNNFNIKRALSINKSLSLPPYSNAKNKSINLHILETHERDKDQNLQTYKHSTGLRDNEILEAVWGKWAAESGFKSFHWQKY